MIELVKNQPGFLWVESAREEIGITVSYRSDLESIKLWREHFEQSLARSKGREMWYKNFTVRIAKVEREYSFNK